MDQTIPNISEFDIKRIVKRDFSEAENNLVYSFLRNYESDSIKGRNRVCASILKLANGDIKILKKLVEKANLDFRDIISLAEYPNYSKFVSENDLSDEIKNKLINTDLKQYEEWFLKE